MKKILVPIDFSPYSEYALEVAANLAHKKGAEILVLHMMGLSEAVINKSETTDVAEALYFMKLAKKRFETFLDQPYLKGIKVKEMVQNYKIFSEINTIATEQDVDLIVMGSHGSSGIVEVFVGSNTEKVVRTSSIPVLVVKEHTPDFKLDRVVFALDFKTEAIEAYRKAMRFFDSFDAKVDLLYVNLPNEQFKPSTVMEENAIAFLALAEPKNHDRYDTVQFKSDYTVERGIFNYSKGVDADLIAIPTHGRRGVAHFFMGSISEDLANHSKIPVMTFKI